ncbi:MAG: hypothetical protein CMA65_03330 [Euryarchaeota archaeon]|nr:hypothetical protein [Euryarchaeota archaeon]
MTEDPLTPRQPPKTLASRLSGTGKKIAELSGKAATATKDAAGKVAGASRDAVTKTGTAVSQAVEAKKERKEERRAKKLEDTKAEIRDDGFIEIAPEMITLPEFEGERMAIMAEEHDVLVELVDHMHSLSTRIDQLETTYRALALDQHPITMESSGSESSVKGHEPTSKVMTSVLSLLGASLVWVVILTGLDRYIASNSIMLFDNYPAEIPVWGIGAASWVVFVLFQLGKSAPFLRVSTPMLIQTGIAVGITTSMALLLTDNTISTMSNVWTWGTAIAVALLVSSGLVASAWKNTQKLLSPNETVELIE